MEFQGCGLFLLFVLAAMGLLLHKVLQRREVSIFFRIITVQRCYLSLLQKFLRLWQSQDGHK